MVKQFKRIIFLPEGDVHNILNYSGTPLYMHFFLKKAIRKYGMSLKLIDTKEILNTEDIWHCIKLIINNRYNTDDIYKKNLLGLVKYKLHFPPNKTLFNTIIYSTNKDKVINAVHDYYNDIKNYVNKLLIKNYRSGDIILSLNTLNPHFTVEIPICYYLDTSLVHFYFNVEYGFLNNIYDNHKLKKYYREIEKRALDKAVRILCFSKACQNQLIESYKLDPNIIDIVYAGCNLNKIKKLDRKYNKKIIKLLFIGLEFELKGGKYLLDAFNKIRGNNIRLTLVTRSEFINKYSNYLKDRRINILSSQKKDRIINLYRSHDIFILPTYFDPFGIVICEAMSFGLPVVATNFFAIPEIIGKFKYSVLVKPKNILSLEKTIRLLINNDTLRSDIGNYNYSRAMQIFNWPVVVNKIIESLNSSVLNR